MSALAIVAAPCGHCPFRKDVPIYLRAERRQEIAEALFDGGDFPCHATVRWAEDDDGEDEPDTSDAKTCAGAAKAIMQAGGSTQLMRIAERLGMADLDRTAQAGAEVWDLDDWVRLAEGSTGGDRRWEVGDDDGVETCETVNAGCLAPAGWTTASGAPMRGTEEADGRCSECEAPLCSNCADDEGRCGMCTEGDDDGE